MNLEGQPLRVSNDFQYVLDTLEEQQTSVFVTGRAGTGKSTLLQLFRRSSAKKVVVLAPTGVAALNAGGQTIHSFFGFPAKYLQRQDIRRRKFRKLYQQIDVLVIDEISMVRADLFDAIDISLRINREDPRPFGGVQVALFGDLYQLPPVVSTMEERQIFSTRYETPYFFSSDVFHDGFKLETITLQDVYRQQSGHFLRLLNDIRNHTLDYDGLEDLNARYLPNTDTKGRIHLCARNATAQAINAKELKALEVPSLAFIAKISGQFKPRLYPTDQVLHLKLGAQVMFVKNDPQRRFVNGTIGQIIQLNEEQITVRVDEQGKQKDIEVKPLSWELLKYKYDEKKGDIEAEVIGSFTQIPLKLAWAITIHKSQGKTFDRVVIELGRGAFEHGQTYVALSRCRTLEGVILKQALRMQDIRVDERIVQFMQQVER